VVNEAGCIVTPSKFLGKRIIGFAPKARAEMIPNGLVSDDFSPMDKEPYFLVVARLFPNKGIQDLLRALTQVEMGGWRVKIVGDGPYRNTLQKLTGQLGLRNQVEYLGWIQPGSAELKSLYGHASVFVLPSHFENMSMAILEAHAAGCHVIAARVGGNPECVEAENLFEVEDIASLRRQLCRFAGKAVPAPPATKQWRLSDTATRYSELLNGLSALPVSGAIHV
jgi:glycosyltransferase involved in cell wall biosynthesis